MPFVDAEEMHSKYPNDFYYPTGPVRVGDSVKICDGFERFWVTVTNVRGSKLTGRVDNYLRRNSPINYGDKVRFERRNVYAIFS